MLKLCRFSFALLVLNLASGASFAQEDDKKPVPESATPANQPRDPLLLPQHDQSRNDAEQAYRRSDHKKVIELMSGVLAQNPKDHVALYLRGSSRVDLGSASGDAAMIRAGITDARDRSGVQICATDTPRAAEAGVLWLGSVAIDIPPRTSGVTVTGSCPSALTSTLRLTGLGRCIWKPAARAAAASSFRA